MIHQRRIGEGIEIKKEKKFPLEQCPINPKITKKGTSQKKVLNQTTKKEIIIARLILRIREEENQIQMPIQINSRIRLILVLGVLFISCDSNRVFDEYKSITNNSWSQDHSINFKFEITDTISKNNLFINIRNSNQYQFSNLYIISSINFPNGKKIVDTLQYEMADKNGRFLGEGISDIKHNKLSFKENIIFPFSGNYNVSISQAMRKNGSINGIKELHGISDVGFRIEKVN